jgi:hypothetical protein
MPFSLDFFDFDNINMSLGEYLSKLIDFFNTQSIIKDDKINMENDIILKDFNEIKNQFTNFLEINKYILVNKLNRIDEKNLTFISDMLDSIMEWFIVAKIESSDDKNIIIHTGLSHSEEVIKRLTNLYGYKITKCYGSNKVSDNDTNHGCVGIDTYINKEFSRR